MLGYEHSKAVRHALFNNIASLFEEGERARTDGNKHVQTAEPG
jgi:hypothetical protein